MEIRNTAPNTRHCPCDTFLLVLVRKNKSETKKPFFVCDAPESLLKGPSIEIWNLEVQLSHGKKKSAQVWLVHTYHKYLLFHGKFWWENSVNEMNWSAHTLGTFSTIVFTFVILDFRFLCDRAQ
jgi:hypothetical protein